MSLNITQKDLERISNQPGYEVIDQMNGPDLSAAVSNGPTGRQKIEWANGPDLSATGHVSLDTTDTSSFSAKFEQMWAQLEGPDLEHEFRFHTTRRWRFDYCHLATRTAIELEGGVWSRGRHNRAQGFINDCIKYNEAIRSGYSVFRLATGMVTPENLERIIEHIEQVDYADYINRRQL